MPELRATVAEARQAGGPVPVPLPWAPGEACTLPSEEQPLREAEFHALFATALRRVERPEPTLLQLTLDGDGEVVASTRDLTGREAWCCSFFDFRLIATAGGLRLDVRVPEARIAVLDGLARQAEAARSAAEPGSGVMA
ncbi:hypothetical protein [Pseudonocardia adelaidensis]|uniref:hypothetical protein n=1 Tax=Pseudonocardia adelaidensis TaxID=648754 RepID=UPI0031E73175